MNNRQILWSDHWRNPVFRKTTFLAGSILIMITLGFPVFFSFVQQREGRIMNDWLLNTIPSYDVSILIFIVLYTTISFMIVRMIKSPELCITMIWGYIFLCLTRLLTISLVSLDPPDGLIDLADPFSIIFYHTETITKDLFFSGHVSTIFLIGLCLTGKKEKTLAFTASGLMAVLVLIQHIHYTLDVIAAPFFSNAFWYLGQKMTSMACCLKKRAHLIDKYTP